MFVLKDDDLKRLRKITVQYVSYTKLTQILSDLKPSRNVESYSLADDLDFVTLAVLQSANKEGWIDQYIVGLHSLYVAVDEIAAFHDMVVAARAAVPAVTPAPALPADLAAPSATPDVAMAVLAPDNFAVVYVDNRPFVNRRELRTTLKKLTAPKGPRILKIHGNRRTGKTYTYYLISHLAQHCGFGVVPIDLARFDDVTPYELGHSINARMGFPDPPRPSNEQWSRWTRRYFDRLSGHVQATAASSKRQWWIIMDNFKAVSVSEALNDFVDDLATRINEELRDVRAILISYERRLPSHVDPIVVEDKTCDIGVEELSEFFIQFLSEAKPHLSVVDRTQRAAVKVAEVLVNSGHAPGAPLDGIGAELLTQCRKIMEEAP